MKKAKDNRNIGDEIIAGLTEIRDALQSGKQLNARRVPIIDRPSPYDAKHIRALREQLNTSQAVFAGLMCVSVHTVQSWEQGKTDAPPMACRLMEEIKHNPERWMTLLHTA